MDIKELFTEEELQEKVKFQDKVADFVSDLNECYQEIIETRRSGEDLFVEELLYRTIKSKIEYLKASESEDTLNDMKKMIIQLKSEIEVAKTNEIVNVKKEVEKDMKKEGIHYIGEVDEEDTF